MAKKSFTEKALNNKEAKQAIGEGIVNLLETHDFDSSWKAMIDAARKNGSLPVVQGAVISDLLRGIADRL